jgi:predicted molibdopterin-dependent oxidoreductase YjgC
LILSGWKSAFIGENPKLSDPDWQHLHHAIKELDFLVVQDPYRRGSAIFQGNLAGTAEF